jgi:hypothetical protein
VKAHLLFPAADLEAVTDLCPQAEDLMADLELTTLLEAMADGDDFVFETCQRVLLASLDDPAEIRYRQDVLTDCLAQPGVVRALYGVSVAAIEAKRNAWGYMSRTPASILSSACRRLEAFVELLHKQREIADQHADEFRSDGFTALFAALRAELDDDYFHSVGEYLKDVRFKDGVVISADLDRDNSVSDLVLRSPERTHSAWKERLGIGPRTSYSFTIPARDEAGFNALGDLTDRGVNLVANALAQSADHIFSYLMAMRTELAFYVGCLELHEQLGSRDVPTCQPTPLPQTPDELTFAGLDDVCLALCATQPVVGNDADATGKDLVVVTGANSGGKSTFLRSVGLAQLMMQCGLFVAAESFSGSVASGLYTHFIRDEDPTMTSGRLVEELDRMSDIVDLVRPHGLVLFNESFASTNESEGSEIARQVVHALLAAGVRVLFVTHQFDFAHSCYRDRRDSTLFLRAERLPDGRRPFALVEAPRSPRATGRTSTSASSAPTTPLTTAGTRDETPGGQGIVPSDSAVTDRAGPADRAVTGRTDMATIARED